MFCCQGKERKCASLNNDFFSREFYSNQWIDNICLMNVTSSCFNLIDCLSWIYISTLEFPSMPFFIKFEFISLQPWQDIKCLSSAFSRQNEFKFDIVQQATLFAFVFSTSPVSRCHLIFLLSLDDATGQFFTMLELD